MQRQPTPRADILLSVFLIIVCVITLWESRKIPPGSFEPLGSGPVPQTIAVLIILLCLSVIVRARTQLRSGSVAAEATDTLTLRTLDTIIFAVLTIVYAAILHLRWLDFALLTTLFLIVTIGLLTRFQTRQLPIVIGVAAVMGYGCEYLFTQVFVVDLPGAF